MLYTEYNIYYFIIFKGCLTGLSFALAVVRPPRVVASLGDAPVFARINQTVRTVVQFRLTVHAFPVTIAVSRIGYYLVFGFARVFLYVGRLELCLTGA